MIYNAMYWIIFLLINSFLMGSTESCTMCNNTDLDQKYRQRGCCNNFCQNQENSQNKKPLQPILFSEMGSINDQDQANKTKEVFERQLQHKVQVTTGEPYQSDDKKSQQSEKDQSFNGDLVVVNFTENDHEIYGAENYEPISVPFSVIKLTLNRSIARQINSNDKTFFQVHENPSGQYFNTWKLQPKGYYSNFINDGSYILISEKYFYSGNCSAKDKKFVLSGQGVLISKDGTFRGNFKNSRANGKGSFLSLREKKLCEGVWENGQLKKGTIQSLQYLYNGQLQKGCPSGFGKLKIKNKNISYEGNFLNGKFHDQKAQYVCKQYNYRGGFKEGKKNGKGTLREKDSEVNKRKNKRKQLLVLTGLWENDSLVQQEKIA